MTTEQPDGPPSISPGCRFLPGPQSASAQTIPPNFARSVRPRIISARSPRPVAAALRQSNCAARICVGRQILVFALTGVARLSARTRRRKPPKLGHKSNASASRGDSAQFVLARPARDLSSARDVADTTGRYKMNTKLSGGSLERICAVSKLARTFAWRRRRRPSHIAKAAAAPDARSRLAAGRRWLCVQVGAR